MKKQNYVAFLEHDRDTGKYGVVVPDIPGLTVGDSCEDALKKAGEGLAGHIGVMEECGEYISSPRPVERIKSEWPDWENWRKETVGDIVAMVSVATSPVLQAK
ncbi:MAG: type II toxin-antitoxin system HicB family antitoxin [Chitinispirillia bacterium]|nr:type II toxin-antitoxin system HicB family antitoxin [Chitinispirillia bacterium]MCL2242283.1 type II toxin-antitoxin system HicB family antitoxin [Chitinispirillia bacterium]